MSFSRQNLLDLALDIAGSLARHDNLSLADEAAGIGRKLSNGTGASVAVSGGVTTVSGVSGMSASSVGSFLKLSNGNDGYGPLLITGYVSATSVTVSDPTPSLSDGWTGLAWSKHNAYSAEDDINYARTDRAAIKGVSYDAAIPTHTNPKGETVTMNLASLAGKTIDAKGFILPRMVLGQSISDGATTHTLTHANPLVFKHSDSSNGGDRTGVPTVENNDGYQACFVEILNSATENEFVSSDGYKVFGVTMQDGESSGTVKVAFKKVAFGAELDTAQDYAWEGNANVMMSYGYYQVISDMDEDAFRKVQVLGLASDGDLRADIDALQSAVGMNDGDTNIASHLTNTGNNFAFQELTGTATVVDALNELNEQLGDFTFGNQTQFILDTNTVAENLKALADAVVAAQIVRIVKRITQATGDIPAGTPFSVRNGAHSTITYTNDGTGDNLWVFTRGLLRSPGDIAEGNDYTESSDHEVTFHMTLRVGDHVNFFLRNHN